MIGGMKMEGTSGLKRLGNVQHAAYRCRDAAQTRWFYEQVLGLPLKIALVAVRRKPRILPTLPHSRPRPRTWSSRPA